MLVEERLMPGREASLETVSELRMLRWVGRLSLWRRELLSRANLGTPCRSAYRCH